MVWVCELCGEPEPQHEGRSRACADCQRARGIYRTTQGNLKSGFNRTNKGSPNMGVSLEEFCRWRKAQRQICHYCGISEQQIALVGMKSQIQRPVRTMGVDRLDSSIGYVGSNLVPCCFVCNQVKGDRFTEAEMLLIGPAIGKVWRARLAGSVPREKVQAAAEQAVEGLGQTDG